MRARFCTFLAEVTWSTNHF